MRVVAYLFSNPLLEPTPDATLWGWEVDQVYCDVGTGDDRPNLQRLLHDSPAPQYVLVRQLAELGNTVEAVAEVVQQLEGRGSVVMAIAHNNCTPHSAVPLRIAAEVQAVQQSRRIQAGHARNRLKALPPPGRAPYGYRRGQDRYLLDRATAPVVKAFFERFLLFGSVRGAVRYLETTYGKRISVSTGRRWLTNPVYRGDLVYQDGRVIAETHVPLMSREEAAQIDRLLRRNRRLPPRTTSAPRSLAGLVQCAVCQSRLRVSRVSRPRQSQEYLYLRPSACDRTPRCKALPYEEVLDRTIERVCQDLPAAISTLQRPPTDAIKGAIAGQIAQKQAVLKQLPDLLAAGVLDTTTADLRAYTLRSDIAALDQKLAQLPPDNLPEIAKTLSIPQFWRDLSESERRVYLREFIREIQILRPDSRTWDLQLQFVFDPASIMPKGQKGE